MISLAPPSSSGSSAGRSHRVRGARVSPRAVASSCSRTVITVAVGREARTPRDTERRTGRTQQGVTPGETGAKAITFATISRTAQHDSGLSAGSGLVIHHGRCASISGSYPETRCSELHEPPHGSGLCLVAGPPHDNRAVSPRSNWSQIGGRKPANLSQPGLIERRLVTGAGMGLAVGFESRRPTTVGSGWDFFTRRYVQAGRSGSSRVSESPLRAVEADECPIAGIDSSTPTISPREQPQRKGVIASTSDAGRPFASTPGKSRGIGARLCQPNRGDAGSTPYSGWCDSNPYDATLLKPQPPAECRLRGTAPAGVS